MDWSAVRRSCHAFLGEFQGCLSCRLPGRGYLVAATWSRLPHMCVEPTPVAVELSWLYRRPVFPVLYRDSPKPRKP